MPINSVVQTGFQNASRYDTHRPSYPAGAVDKLLSHLSVVGVKKAQIIEVGCGTGKFTEQLVQKEEEFEILAVEPHAGMRRMFIMEMGGNFGLIWNIDDYNGPRDWNPATKLDGRLKQLVIDIEDDHPRFRHMKWKEVFDNQQNTNPLQTLVDTFTKKFPSFSLPLGEETFKWTVWLSEEGVWSRITTLSQIVNLDVEKGEKIHQQVVEALKEDGVERNEKGEVVLHGCTYLAWTSQV